jgi:hypothetical protein
MFLWLRVGPELWGKQDAGGVVKGEGAVHSHAVDGAGAPGPDLQALCCECSGAVQLAPPHQKKYQSVEWSWLQLM